MRHTPEDWIALELGDVIALASGNTRPRDFALQSNDYNRVPVYGGNGVTGYTPEPMLEGEQVIIGRVGENCGAVHFVDKPCWATDNALYIRAIFADAKHKYLYYLLDHLNLSGLRSKGGQPLVSQGPIYKLPIKLPPFAEQSHVIAYLETWDRAISLTERLIAAKLTWRKGLMQQLLTGKRRFPGFSEPWREVHLREVTTESLARNNRRLGRESVRAVTNSAGMIPMREQTIADVLDRYMVVEPRAFAYNPMRINVGSLCMWPGDEPCLVSPDYVVFNCKAGELDADYFDYLRHTHRWDHSMQAAGNGSVRVRIYYDDLAALKFVIPPFPEQIRISAFLRSLDRELLLLRSQLAALKTQKRGLMQQLLTGKVRVQVAAA